MADMQIVRRGGGGGKYGLGVEDFKIIFFNSGGTLITWKDPEDSSIATWGGTMIVRKEGSFPVNESDGVVVVDSKIRNQYEEIPFIDETAVEGVENFYRIFPYTDKGVFVVGSPSEEYKLSGTYINLNPGPGSIELQQGDMTAGWFGEVTTAGFGADHAQIASLLGLSAGTLQNQTEPFLMFIHDGKI